MRHLTDIFKIIWNFNHFFKHLYTCCNNENVYTSSSCLHDLFFFYFKCIPFINHKDISKSPFNIVISFWVYLLLLNLFKYFEFIFPIFYWTYLLLFLKHKIFFFEKTKSLNLISFLFNPDLAFYVLLYIIIL